MITINKAILHILDFHSDIRVFSERELDTEDNSVNTFLAKHIEKSFKDSNLKTGKFLEGSQFKEGLIEYFYNRLDFISFSHHIAQRIHAVMEKSDQLDSMDVILADFVLDGQRMLGLLFCPNKIGFTHQVLQDTDKVKNDIIHHYAILPSTSQKLEGYAFINLSSLEIKFHDKKRSISGDDAYIIPEYIMQCSSGISPKETVKLMNDITERIADNYGQSTVMAVSKAKNVIVDNIQVSEDLDAEELGKQIFASSPAMQEEFVNEVKNAGLSNKVKMDKNIAIRLGKNHKIKTDTGIELIIPVDYFENKEYIEFINNPDGTLSIQVKNIGQILNK